MYAITNTKYCTEKVLPIVSMRYGQHFFITWVCSSGISLAVTVRLKSLALSLTVPATFRNKTRGLLGNFNGIKDDDFILPNETSIGPNPSERQIYEMFGPACEQLQYLGCLCI